MNKDEITNKFNHLLDDVIAEGDKESMDVSSTMFKKAVCMLAHLDVKRRMSLSIALREHLNSTTT